VPTPSQPPAARELGNNLWITVSDKMKKHLTGYQIGGIFFVVNDTLLTLKEKAH
jgi:hypothetical protein